MPVLTYKQAGVDVAASSQLVRQIERLARATRRRELVQGIGSFGGAIQLPGAGGILVASADGVGTKLHLAQKTGIFKPLGVDLVAMNVNDLVCTGAEPLFFLDYLAVGKLQKKVLLQIVRGVVAGCVQSRCLLLGGETAEMPLVYKPHQFDLAGFAVGQVRPSRLLTGKKIRTGDVVLGLPSSGLHANGFTLVQKALSQAKLNRWARSLLKPTRIYVREILGLLNAGLPVRGVAHITGGSFEEKLPKILPAGLSVRLNRSSWRVPELFRRIAAEGIQEKEMYRTFNMGIGMAVVLPKSAVSRTQKKLSRSGLKAPVIGEVIRGKRKVVWDS